MDGEALPILSCLLLDQRTLDDKRVLKEKKINDLMIVNDGISTQKAYLPPRLADAFARLMSASILATLCTAESHIL